MTWTGPEQRRVAALETQAALLLQQGEATAKQAGEAKDLADEQGRAIAAMKGEIGAEFRNLAAAQKEIKDEQRALNQWLRGSLLAVVLLLATTVLALLRPAGVTPAPSAAPATPAQR